MNLSASEAGWFLGVADGVLEAKGNNFDRQTAATIMDQIDNYGLEIPNLLSGEWAGESISEISHQTGIDLSDPDNADEFLDSYANGYCTAFTDVLEEIIGNPDGERKHKYCRIASYPGIAFFIDADYGDEVICHMVGDNHSFTFDTSEVTMIDDSEFCFECGQTGCHSSRYIED